ncbi:MAG: transketolase family protein, partial [Coriobacteriales bacterium]|nr:transketolase family protein [Coriobacteriales bacterium]
ELYQEGCPVYAVDADLAGSTTTAKLASVAPGHHIDVGIAEQNMIDVAAGLSLAGNVVFTGSFAVFGTGRVYDQIRNTVCYAQLNVKIAPTHAGISVGPDGGSHQMLEDVALMSVLPHMRVLVPADYQSAKQALRIAAQNAGPFYIRLGRAALPELYGPAVNLTLGQAQLLRQGRDLTILAMGTEVSFALEAAKVLAQEGIEAEVIDVFSVKPLDETTILDSVAKTGRVVTVEEHSVRGGLGTIVASLLVLHPGLLKAPLQLLGMQDCFGTSGTAEQLFAHFGLDAGGILEAARRLL